MSFDGRVDLVLGSPEFETFLGCCSVDTNSSQKRHARIWEKARAGDVDSEVINVSVPRYGVRQDHRGRKRS